MPAAKVAAVIGPGASTPERDIPTVLRRNSINRLLSISGENGKFLGFFSVVRLDGGSAAASSIIVGLPRELKDTDRFPTRPASPAARWR